MKLLCAVLLCSALPMAAAEPFTGIWKEDLTTLRFSGKPQKIELSQGTYKCLSCDPSYTAKADGKDQAVSAIPGIDTISVRIIDDHSVEFIQKKAGKIVYQYRETVSSDGATATKNCWSFLRSDGNHGEFRRSRIWQAGSPYRFFEPVRRTDPPRGDQD